MFWAARASSARVLLVADYLQLVNQFLRAQIQQQFARELGRMTDADADATLDAAYALTSFDSYDSAIRTLDATPDTVASMWRRGLDRLLAPAA